MKEKRELTRIKKENDFKREKEDRETNDKRHIAVSSSSIVKGYAANTNEGLIRN